MTIGCDAVLPPGMLRCGAPATAVYRYACPCGHIRSRAACADHQPAPGATGCLTCHQGNQGISGGHECPMYTREPR